MLKIRRILVSIAVGAFLFTLAAHAQDEPSLGDVARQSRLQKQQKNSDVDKDSSPTKVSKGSPAKSVPANDSSSKDNIQKMQDAPKLKRVITNDEIPEHVGATRTLPSKVSPSGYTRTPDDDGKPSAEYWKTQIQAQKDNLVALQDQIAELANSIQFAGASCVANCVQFNQEQLRKQEQLESMKAQLELQQKSLEEFQNAARKQGFGSSVYDP